jgi:hypothetical protein
MGVKNISNEGSEKNDAHIFCPVCFAKVLHGEVNIPELLCYT